MDSSSCCSSLLSQPDWTEAEKHEASDEIFYDTTATLEQLLEPLERNYALRDKAFRSFSQKDETRYASLWKEEALVRRQERTTILRSYGGLPANPCSRRQEWRSHGMYETISFEVFMVVPTVMRLILHTLVHIGIYGLAQTAVSVSYKNVAIWLERWASDDEEEYGMMMVVEQGLLMCLFCLGLFLLRMSGILFWWSSSRDYARMKFVYHNRHLLGYWDARVLSWMKRHEVVRAAAYFVGYTCCDLAISDSHWGGIVTLFDNRHHLLGDILGSQGPGTMVNGRPVELVNADAMYSWKVLSPSSYLDFWCVRNQLYDEEEADAVIMSATSETVCYALTLVISLWLLSKVRFSTPNSMQFR